MLVKRNKLSAAILVASSAALTSGFTSAVELEELVVTATKRAASTQDIPVAVQALGEESLEALNVDSFDDYLKQLPNVVGGGRGPGQNVIFIRGQSTSNISVLLSGTQGTQPNTALYLDEQPVNFPGRNLDVYATDLERIEVLGGPQGTLFGASAMAGSVRLITNKPKIGELEGGFTTSVETTKSGDLSSRAEAYINLPVGEKLAVRGAFYSVQQGGYIDNVPGTFTPDRAQINNAGDLDNDITTGPLPAGTTFETATNTNLVEENFNDSSYLGFRLGAKYEINDSWDALLQYSSQELRTDGVFDVDPSLGDLQVNRFTPDQSEDEFQQLAWTLSGDVNDNLQVVYTGSFLNREVQQNIDYTGYTNVGAFAAYYLCLYDGVRTCLDPTKNFRGDQESERNTHEFRLTADLGERVSVIAGLFYDELEIQTSDEYIYTAISDLGFFPNAPITGVPTFNTATRPLPTAFFNDVTRTDEEYAFFGEVAVDIIPDLVSLSLSGRYYDRETRFEGSSNFANGPFQPGDSTVDNDQGGAGGRAYSIEEGFFPITDDDFIPKVTLNYTPSDDSLVYLTYSEGYRPSGFNRLNDVPGIPATYRSDEIENIELGWKSDWLDGSLRWNGAAYMVDWTDVQVSRLEPSINFLTFIENAVDAEIFGIESDASWLVNDNLSLFFNVSYNDTETTSDNTTIFDTVPTGTQLPLIPELQGNLRARYEWQSNGLDYFAQFIAFWSDDRQSSLVASENITLDSYTTYDASFGVSIDNVNVSIYGENLGDERVILSQNLDDDIPRNSVNRPRTIGLKVSYDFN